MANFLARLVPPHLWARAHFSRFDPKSRTLEQSYSAPGCSAFAFKVTEHLGIREVQLDSSNPHENALPCAKRTHLLTHAALCTVLLISAAFLQHSDSLHCESHIHSRGRCQRRSRVRSERPTKRAQLFFGAAGTLAPSSAAL